MEIFARIWYMTGDSVAPAEGFFQPRPALSRYPVTVDIHGDENRAVAKLLLNIARTDMGHQNHRRIRMAQIMGIARL